MTTTTTVLILGANSDVAKECILLYIRSHYTVIAASRNTTALKHFAEINGIPDNQLDIRYFDATAFDTHDGFLASLPAKPHIVLYAAGFQVTNDEALADWDGSYQMIRVLYAGAVSILNRIVTDKDNPNLRRIIGLSSLS